jgi:hypothetical protein
MKFRHLLLAGFVLAVIAATVFLAIKFHNPVTTLAKKLEQEITQKLPNGSPRSAVEQWLQSQPIQPETFPASRLEVAVERAGLKANEVQTITQAVYHELRWPFSYEIQVYFFYDADGNLIKHWIFEREDSP